MRLFQTPGAVLSPFVVEGRLKRSIQRASRVDERYTAWLEPREGRPEVPPGPALLPPGDLIVVLLTVDSFRADLIGDQRYTQVLSELEAMRQQALNFDRMDVFARPVGERAVNVKCDGEWFHAAQFDRMMGGRESPDGRTGRISAVVRY